MPKKVGRMTPSRLWDIRALVEYVSVHARVGLAVSLPIQHLGDAICLIKPFPCRAELIKTSESSKENLIIGNAQRTHIFSSLMN